MKAKNLFMGLLPMAAALMLTACNNDDNEIEAGASNVKTIPFTATASTGQTTRVTMGTEYEESGKKYVPLLFSADDELEIYGATGNNAYVSGTLTLKAGDAGKSTDATFEGALTYKSVAPTSETEISAELYGPDYKTYHDAHSKARTREVTRSYIDVFPTTLADAVQKWSYLYGQSTYGEGSFTLTQQMAFLNFVVTFTNDTKAPADGTYDAQVVNGVTTFGLGGGSISLSNSSDVGRSRVTITTSQETSKKQAKFVAPVFSGNTLDNAVVRFYFGNNTGSGLDIPLGSNGKTLVGKVYNVTKTDTQGYYWDK